METLIITQDVSDLLDIFDPEVQEENGGARILYTFDEDRAPVRRRVGELFFLQTVNQPVTFVVHIPLSGTVEEGYVVITEPVEGIENRYYLSREELEQLVFDVTLVYNGEEAAQQLFADEE